MMLQQDLIKLHALLSKLQRTASETAQLDANFKEDYIDSIQKLVDFSDQLNHLEEGLKSAKVIKYTFRDANWVYELITYLYYSTLANV